MSRNHNINDIPQQLMRHLGWLRDDIQGWKTPLEWFVGARNWDAALDSVRVTNIRNRLQSMLNLLDAEVRNHVGIRNDDGDVVGDTGDPF